LDCMGHYSPIVKQMRGKAKPEGMVIVVGGCAEGEGWCVGWGPGV
jgi:lycopene cyclase CruP